MTKTVAAFQMTADQLWQPGFRVYFWTFTFTGVNADWENSRRFTKFLHHLQAVLDGDWGGVRVAELHKEHGVHFHALINRRLAVDIVRRVARCYGIGRIFVEVADNNNGTARYLSKYLSKQKKGPLCESGRSMRRWAKFGQVRHVRIRDLVNFSPMWVFRREHKMTFLGYVNEHLLQQAWDRGEDTFIFCYNCLLRDEPGPVFLALGTQYEVSRHHYTFVLVPRADKVFRRVCEQVPF